MDNTSIWFVWFPDLNRVPPLNSKLVRELAYLLSQWMETGKLEDCSVSTELREDDLPRILFLSFNSAHSPAYVYRGNGFGIVAALKKAYAQFIKEWGGRGPHEQVKLDVVQSFKSLGEVSLNAKLPLELSLEGLAFSRNSKVALLPEQIISNALLPEGMIHRQRLYNTLAHAPFMSAHYAQLETQKTTEAYTFTTASTLLERRQVIPLYRGKREVDKPTTEELKYRLESAALYLTRGLYPYGRFNYIFYPDRNRASADYNITRHAGTTYALFEFCQFFPNKTVLQAAKKSLFYLSQYILPGRATHSVCVVDQGFSKLGANALALIAFAKYIDVTQDKNQLSTLLKLGEWVIDKIRADGQCLPQKELYLKASTDPIDPYDSLYYPGEAILGLLRLSAHDPNPKWLDFAEKAAIWLITVRDKDKSERDLLHDHWLLYGLNELYRRRPQMIFIEHTKRICNSIMAAQIENGRYPDWTGGFYKPPRSTPTAARTEGLCAAYCLLRDQETHQEYLNKILDSIEKSILFQFRTQFLEESCMYFPNPLTALGGFHSSLTEYEMRIDYTQHNMSSLLGLYKIITQTIQHTTNVSSVNFKQPSLANIRHDTSQ